MYLQVSSFCSPLCLILHYVLLYIVKAGIARTIRYFSNFLITYA